MAFLDRNLAGKSGRDSARRLRDKLRVHPRLEVLENRCLMSGLHTRITPNIDAPRAVRDQAVTIPSIELAAHRRLGPRQTLAANGSRASSTSFAAQRRTEDDIYSSATDPSLSVIPGMPPGAYTVVPETKNPHHTFATAQRLPFLPFFGVVGTIAAGDLIDLYRLTLDSAVERMDFGLVTAGSAATVPIQLEIFDGWGRVLGEWSVDAQSASSLHAALSGLSAGSTFYVGISAGNQGWSDVSSPTVGYQLWISLEPNTASAAASAGTTLAAPAITSTTALPAPASTGLAVALPKGDSQPAAASSPSQAIGLGVAVGSPALRSARPSGGLLSDGDPAPPAARSFGADVNKEWDEQSLTSTAPRPGDENEPTARDNDPAALVVTRGPGGFPLLGAFAIGHRRRNRATDVGDFATPPVMAGQDAPAAAGLGMHDVLASSGPAVNEGDETGRSEALRVVDWGAVPATVFSGLGLATVLTFNALLSQPIAGFDYLTARLDASRRSRLSRTK